jgi:hypothetical protein
MQEVAILLYNPPERPKFQEALPNAVKPDELANTNSNSNP